MRLAVDVTAALDRPTGVGVVLTNLLAGLSTDPSLDVIGYAASWRGRDRLDAVAAAIRTPIARRPMAAQPLRRLWMRSNRPVIEWWTGPVDVVWGPNFVVPPARDAAGLVTVHDLTCVRFPTMVTSDVAQYPGLLRRAAARGAHVHTVSEFVAEEVQEWLGLAEERVHVVPNGIDADAFAAGDAARGRALAGGSDYVLSVATLEPRKDIVGLVVAFDALAPEHPDLRLVLAGGDGWGAAEVHAAVRAARHADRIVTLGHVDDGARLDLLAGARLLAYPSRYEGFGLPVLEAMAAGTPVVATAAGAIPEVCGDAAVLVPVGDRDALGAAISTVASDEGVRRDLVERGRQRVGRFSWESSVAGLRRSLDAVAADHH